MTATGTGADPWVEAFERSRPRLLGLAYRMLGTVADAEDIVQESLGRSPAACRQIASRARARVRVESPLRTRLGGDRRVVEELLVAVAIGDIDGVVARLAPDARCVSDGGAAKRAARRPVVGATRVARFLINTTRKVYDQAMVELVTLNRSPGMIVSVAGEVDIVATFEFDDEGRVAAIWMVRNPDKLTHLTTPIDLT